jgi:DNA-binding MarR family transcriptional regulator
VKDIVGMTDIDVNSETASRLTSSFTYRLHVLHKRTDIQTQRVYAKSLGLSLSDARCLSVVGSFGPLSVNDLAAQANLDKGQASRAAQSLVNQALLEKSINNCDGRGVVIKLSAKGKKVFDKVIKTVEQRNQEILSPLDKNEQLQLSMLLDRLIASAQT